MAIRSDVFEYDMSPWLYEKTDHALKTTCALADWLGSTEHELSKKDMDRLEKSVRELLYRLTTILWFASEGSEPGTLKEWEEVLLRKGSEALKYFKKAITQHPIPAPPSIAPGVARGLTTLNELEKELSQDDPDKARIRELIVGKLPDALSDDRFNYLGTEVDELSALVDQQVSNNEITWDQFLYEVRPLVGRLRLACADIAEENRWMPPAK
jgi:hypothetical protein